MRRFNKILIANRGEIACRVIRTARAMGYATVAVFSDADATARHVELADEAFRLGEAPLSASYLNADRILAAALTTGATALHPGYGFLSENADFAEACVAAGLTFIGPSPASIRLMGDKARSKRRMIEAGVPCVPGYEGDDQGDATFLREAERLGGPIMVKASAGGGGRGMRLVHDLDTLAAALASARSEAAKSFGDGRLLLERAVIDARHVEIQVFGDTHGTVLHFGERDCSVQRRHQKVIEEAPSPAVDAELRARMGAAAVKAAAAIDYVGAGTVEFLLAGDGRFYFLEMNTRLQVEHPVTEAVTGLDLVALQLAVAAGEPLPMAQSDVALSGHAIEARLYAEDPANQFLPQSGVATLWRPAAGEGVRIDHGLQSGQSISPFYDPMVAKLIAYGDTREAALRRLRRALRETVLLGVATNKGFLLDATAVPEFVAGAATTAFIGRHFPDGHRPDEQSATVPLALAAVLAAEGDDPGWNSSEWLAHPVRLKHDDSVTTVLVRRDGAGWRAAIGDTTIWLAVQRHRGDAEFSVRIGDHRQRAHAVVDGDTVHLDLDGRVYRFTDVSPEPAMRAGGGGDTVLRAPMTGAIIALRAAEGDAVKRGQVLAVLEAMKIEHEITALVDGVVSHIGAAVGTQVAARDILFVIEPA